MKIVLATALGFGVGGVRSHICTLKKSLEKKCYETEIIFPPPLTNLIRIITGIKAGGSRDKARVKLNQWYQKEIYCQIRKLAERNDFDLIHAHDVLAANCLCDAFPNKPLVLTVHGPLSREALMLNKGSQAYLNYLEEQEFNAYNKAQLIIAVDSEQKRIICEDYNVNPEKVRIIYNAVDTDFFSPKEKKEVQGFAENLFFLVPRRLVPKNGVDVAVRAMKYIKSDVELWVAGDGEERENLYRLTCEQNLKSKIKFLGFVDSEEMVDLINRSLGVIVPSVPVCGVVEASSISALEGMSVGKVVIASKIGGLREIIKEGQTGMLFEAGNAQQLAYLMQFVIDNPDYAQTIGKNARSYVIKNYSTDIWIEKIIAVYKEALASKL